MKTYVGELSQEGCRKNTNYERNAYFTVAATYTNYAVCEIQLHCYPAGHKIWGTRSPWFPVLKSWGTGPSHVTPNAPSSSLSGDSNHLDASLNVARSRCVLALKLSVHQNSLSPLGTSRSAMRFLCLENGLQISSRYKLVHS